MCAVWSELQHFSLLQILMFSWCVQLELSCNRDWTATFQPITDTKYPSPVPSCVCHFTTSLLSPYFPLIILPPGFFSYYFPHLFTFPYSLPHFHPIVESLVSLMSLILNCGQVGSILRFFMVSWAVQVNSKTVPWNMLSLFPAHFSFSSHWTLLNFCNYKVQLALCTPCNHTMEMSGRLLLLATLAPGQSIQYPWNGRLGGPYHWSGHLGDEINLPARNWIMIHQLSSLSHSHNSNNTDSTWDYAICAVYFSYLKIGHSHIGI